MEKQILKEQSNPDIPKLEKAITLGCLPVKNAEVISSKQPSSKLWNTSEGRVGFKFINKFDTVVYYYADMTWNAPFSKSKAKGTWTCDGLVEEPKKDPNELGTASSVPMSPSNILSKY
jgi:hypothetical protein